VPNALDGEQLPLVGHASQRLGGPILKVDPGSGHEVIHGA
jgi:hypothetical protein